MMYKLLSERMNPSPPPNVLITDYVPNKARFQIVYTLNESFSSHDFDHSQHSDIMDKSIDKFSFLKGGYPDEADSHYGTMMSLCDQDFLDLLDIVCNVALNDVYFRYKAADFRKKLNDVLISNSMGYTVAESQLIPCTDIREVEEIIVPSFSTMSELGMTGALNHLNEAYDHFKNRKNSEALLSAFKAMEGAIDWLIDKTSAESSKGIQSKLETLARVLGLDSYLVEDLNKIISILKIPGEIRNKNAGHGSAEITEVEDHLVKFEIDLVASGILFLARCYQVYKDDC